MLRTNSYYKKKHTFKKIINSFFSLVLVNHRAKKNDPENIGTQTIFDFFVPIQKFLYRGISVNDDLLYD